MIHYQKNKTEQTHKRIGYPRFGLHVTMTYNFSSFTRVTKFEQWFTIFLFHWGLLSSYCWCLYQRITCDERKDVALFQHLFLVVHLFQFLVVHLFSVSCGSFIWKNPQFKIQRPQFKIQRPQRLESRSKTKLTKKHERS